MRSIQPEFYCEKTVFLWCNTYIEKVNSVEILFSDVFYGNTVSQWAWAFSVVFLCVIFGKILYWIFGNVMKKATSKTKTKLDDIIIDMIEEPIVFSIILVGIWYSLNTLNLSEFVRSMSVKAFSILLSLNLAWLVSRLFDSLFKEYIVPLASKTDTDLDDQLLPIIRKGVKIIIWILAIIIGLNNAGYDVGALIAGLGIGGLAIAMASKDLISNVFGGFTIFTDKPFTVNDRVKVVGYDGEIIEIGIRSTRLKTLDGRIVTIPNSRFSDSPVENVSSEPSRKIILKLGLTYDMNSVKVKKALEILLKINKETISTEDEAKVYFSEFGDFSLNLVFIYYIRKGEDILKTMTKINLDILESFESEQIEMAYPTQTIYAKNA